MPLEDPRRIDEKQLPFTRRHAQGIAVVVLALSVVGFVGAQWLSFADLPGDDSDSSLSLIHI